MPLGAYSKIYCSIHLTVELSIGYLLEKFNGCMDMLLLKYHHTLHVLLCKRPTDPPSFLDAHSFHPRSAKQQHHYLQLRGLETQIVAIKRSSNIKDFLMHSRFLHTSHATRSTLHFHYFDYYKFLYTWGYRPFWTFGPNYYGSVLF